MHSLNLRRARACGFYAQSVVRLGECSADHYRCERCKMISDEATPDVRAAPYTPPSPPHIARPTHTHPTRTRTRTRPPAQACVNSGALASHCSAVALPA